MPVSDWKGEVRDAASYCESRFRGLKQRVVWFVFGFVEAEVLVGGGGHLAAFGGAADEADLEEEGLDDVFKGVAFFAHGGGHGVDANRAAFVVAGHDGQEAAVEGVEAEL